MNSNSMKSSNPNSGIYKADTSRALDLNGGTPACNQGGMMIYASKSYSEIEKAKVTASLRASGGNQGGGRMETYTDTAPTMRAQAHNHAPIVAAVGVAENSRGELRTTGDVHPCLATGGGKPGEGYPCIMNKVYVSGGYAAFDEKSVAGSVRASGGDRGGGQREPRETVGTLAARDFKGVGNQYVQEGKLVVQDD